MYNTTVSLKGWQKKFASSLYYRNMSHTSTRSNKTYFLYVGRLCKLWWVWVESVDNTFLWQPTTDVLVFSSVIHTITYYLMKGRIHPWLQPCSCKTQCWIHLSSGHHLKYKKRLTDHLRSFVKSLNTRKHSQKQLYSRWTTENTQVKNHMQR